MLVGGTAPTMSTPLVEEEAKMQPSRAPVSSGGGSRRLLGQASSRNVLRAMSQRVLRAGQVPSMYCQICFDRVPIEEAYKLTACGHSFCRSCLREMVAADVSEGQVHIMCTWAAEDDDDDADAIETPHHTPAGACGKIFHASDVKALASDEVWKQYQRWISNADPLTRHCPFCDSTQRGNAAQPAMTCHDCGKEFCFKHSNAHPNTTCAEYERAHRAEEEINRAAIVKMSKPCPKCGALVSKKSGCNQMHCLMCKKNGGECHFCWLCGKEIDGGTFPEHFQWWNIWGCPNSQMDGDASYRGCTRVVAMVLLAILGIPAAILTLASVILCFWVFLAKLHEHGAKGAWKMAKGVFSCWGNFLLFSPVLACCLPFVICIVVDAACCQKKKRKSAAKPPPAVVQQQQQQTTATAEEMRVANAV